MIEYDKWILTHRGHHFSFIDLSGNVYDIKDIAHALAMTCRFGGMSLWHYSVAQHSCHIAEELFRETGDAALALDGLMHDAEEAYMGDMTTPLKRVMPEFRELSGHVDKEIRKMYKFSGVPMEMQPLTKEYDTRILLDEKTYLLPQSGIAWDIEKTHSPLGIHIPQLSPHVAEQRFLELFKYYSSAIGPNNA